MGMDPYQTYRKVQIETANPLELVIKLYDGAIRFMNLAEQSIKENNIEMTNTYLVKSQAIFNELNASLDMEAGGEIAGNLRRLYEFLNRSLIEVNIRKDVELLRRLLKIVTELRSAWIGIQSPKTPETVDESQAVAQ